jgi:nucleoside-diphosphate-sugar epimerase
MSQRIFLAGASGAIGRRLVPLLRQAGYAVTGMTRSASKAELIRQLGAEPAIADAFDYAATEAAIRAAGPAIVIHQLTDLPAGLDPARMSEAIARNARLREEGTHNLVRAAAAAGVRQLVVQSIAWAYAPGPTPHRESDPLDLGAEGDRAISVHGVAALERWALSGPLPACVLRYGRLYGPGTGSDAAMAGFPAVHVDAAAQAAVLAAGAGARGIFNVAEPSDLVCSDRARDVLGWQATFRAGAALARAGGA